MSQSSKAILVAGATGKQGNALIRALLSSSASEFRILAITRSKSSKAAQNLASLSPSISLIEGDLDNPAALFGQAGRLYGVFSVQVNSPGTSAEETQGKALVDLALLHGVQHFVYSSGDRGGPEKSPSNPTPVANLRAKHAIEKHLQSQDAGFARKEGGMTYTILRPTTFFENHTADMNGQGFARMWEQMGQKKLQVVSTRDIGWFAAQAFLHPEDPKYHNAAISLAGDELTGTEAAKIYKEVVGEDVKMIPCLVGSAVKFLKKEEVGEMFKWFENEGYGANVQQCKSLHPGMLDYAGWLREESPFTRRN